MTAALWLGTYLLHSTVLSGVLLLFRRRLRRLDGAEHLWRAALFLPLVSASMTRLPGMGIWGMTIPSQPTAAAPTVWDGAGVATTLAGVCIAIGALLVVRDCIAHRLFLVRLGPRRPAGATLQSQVADLLVHTGIRRPIRLTQAPGAMSPVVLTRTEICLPDRAVRDLTIAHIRVLVAHEVAHVVRGDVRWFVLMAWLESALFLQPLNRLVRVELRHLAELSCDDWAARRVADPIAVASCLVAVAGWLRQPCSATVPAASSARLTERVQRLIEPRASIGRVSTVPCLLALTAIALALPGIAVSVALPGGESMTSADYQRGFDLGRQYAARNGRVPDADREVAALTLHQRAELERQVQARSTGQ